MIIECLVPIKEFEWVEELGLIAQICSICTLKTHLIPKSTFEFHIRLFSAFKHWRLG